jgi:hypothetical protein
MGVVGANEKKKLYYHCMCVMLSDTNCWTDIIFLWYLSDKDIWSKLFIQTRYLRKNQFNHLNQISCFQVFLFEKYQSTKYMLLFIDWMLVPNINNLDFTYFVRKLPLWLIYI